MKDSKKILYKVAVLGLWHQGVVGSACLADMNYDVIAGDLDKNIIKNLNDGKPPIYEPNLESLINKSLKSKKLKFSSNIEDIVLDRKIIFLMLDTPVDEDDKVDLSSFYQLIKIITPNLKDKSILCITAQVPVGTCENIQNVILKDRPDLNLGIAYIPENLRLGEAIERYYNPKMPVIGTNEDWVFTELKNVLNFNNIKWVRANIKTAEMAKHALNTFLATSITFANELGSLCDNVGADGVQIAKILKLEPRIGSKAMLMPGLGFSGGTLARDTKILIDIGKKNNTETLFFDGLWKANIKYTKVVTEILLKEFKTLKNLNISVLGLTYKPNTSTLRRSISISTINSMFFNGASIKAYDPKVDTKELKENKKFSFFDNPYDAINNSDLIVIMTGWDEFKHLDFKKIKLLMKGNYLLDTNNMLDLEYMQSIGFNYKCIGRGQ